MNDIVFNDYIQMVNFFKHCECELGYGIEGYCYKYKNMSYKLYNNGTCMLNNNPNRISELLKFKNVIVDNIYFIRCLLFIGDDLIGVGSNYAPGVSCEKIFLHRKNLDTMIIALDILKKNIYSLSSKGIYISDFDLGNILYNDKVFSLIDTVDYYYNGDMQDDRCNIDTIDDIYRKNMVIVMRELFKGITDANTYCDNFVLAYLNKQDSKYKDYLIDTELLLNPVDTIMGIRMTIEEDIGRKIQSFSNCRKDLLRIRKK